MPNTITLAKNFTNLLDEVYQNASVTADLTGDASMCRAGANVNEISYPQIETSGLGDYDRNSGYAGGTVSLEWRTTKFNYDRGTKISVDTMDNEETYNLAYGRVDTDPYQGCTGGGRVYLCYPGRYTWHRCGNACYVFQCKRLFDGAFGG